MSFTIIPFKNTSTREYIYKILFVFNDSSIDLEEFKTDAEDQICLTVTDGFCLLVSSSVADSPFISRKGLNKILAQLEEIALITAEEKQAVLGQYAIAPILAFDSRYERIYPAEYLTLAEAVQRKMTESESVNISDPLYQQLYDEFYKLDKKVKAETSDILFHEPYRYKDIKTVKQAEFEFYPAAKITMKGDENKFDVIAEGPKMDDLEKLHLLKSLKKLNINVLIAVGEPQENGKEKFYNYMEDDDYSKKISITEFFDKIADSHGKKISITELFNKIAGSQPHFAEQNLQNLCTNFKFYRYQSPKEGEFYIMHVPSWQDHGMPALSQADKFILGCFFELEINSLFHCSAGVGRSVALLAVKRFYNLFKQADISIDEEQIVEFFKETVARIKAVKPLAGEFCQLLTVPGLAEDIYALVGSKLKLTSKNVEEEVLVQPYKILKIA